MPPLPVLAPMCEEPPVPLVAALDASVVPDRGPVEEAVVTPLDVCIVCDLCDELSEGSARSAPDGEGEHAASPATSPRLAGRRWGRIQRILSRSGGHGRSPRAGDPVGEQWRGPQEVAHRTKSQDACADEESRSRLREPFGRPEASHLRAEVFTAVQSVALATAEVSTHSEAWYRALAPAARSRDIHRLPRRSRWSRSGIK